MAISRQKEARSRDYALLLFRMTFNKKKSKPKRDIHPCKLDVGAASEKLHQSNILVYRLDT